MTDLLPSFSCETSDKVKMNYLKQVSPEVDGYHFVYDNYV